MEALARSPQRLEAKKKGLMWLVYSIKEEKGLAY